MPFVLCLHAVKQAVEDVLYMASASKACGSA
jgi:hypothetical protein